jgi:hypothetical protein
MAMDEPRRRREPSRVVVVADCACTPSAPCLFHYDQLDPGRRTAARRQAGVSEQYLGDRRR